MAQGEDNCLNVKSPEDMWVVDIGPGLEDVARWGGKAVGLSLAMAQGFPVPQAFCVAADAWPHGQRLPDALRAKVLAAYASLGAGLVAVRSSSRHEDGHKRSWAGAFDTFLNVEGSEALVAAIERVVASGAPVGTGMAVVVQRMVAPSVAGVLFTKDPVSGQPSMMFEGTAGLADRLVAGDVAPWRYTLPRPLADSHAWPRPAPEGITLEDLAQLAQWGERLETHFGQSVDIEWAKNQESLWLLQVRPVTPGGRPKSREVWNDSESGDFLWTRTNFGEAVPEVMTPMTWDLMQRFLREAFSPQALCGVPLYGNLGGHLFANVSLMADLGAAFGVEDRLLKSNEQILGPLPSKKDRPRTGLNRIRLMLAAFGPQWRTWRRVRRDLPRLEATLKAIPLACANATEAIAKASSPLELLRLDEEDLDPLFITASQAVQTAVRQGGTAHLTLREDLVALLGQADADALLTTEASVEGALESVNPARMLLKVARGEWSPQAYVQSYGHRGPQEFEVSSPRPFEVPGALERLLALAERDGQSVERAEKRLRERRERLWERLKSTQPHLLERLRHDVASWTRTARHREQSRSEIARVFAVRRAWLLKASALLNLADAVFFLTLEEVRASLRGNASALERVGGRRAAYRYYSAQPPPPPTVRGRHEPGARLPRTLGAEDLRHGLPASSGTAEGPVRVLLNDHQISQFEEGEVLVARTTNVGWTVAFSRAAAVVTDVGAVLSHAAIVARELGVPAVVGCGDASTWLHTGDWVRVDGSSGRVERLKVSNATLSRP